MAHKQTNTPQTVNDQKRQKQNPQQKKRTGKHKISTNKKQIPQSKKQKAKAKPLTKTSTGQQKKTEQIPQTNNKQKRRT